MIGQLKVSIQQGKHKLIHCKDSRFDDDVGELYLTTSNEGPPDADHALESDGEDAEDIRDELERNFENEMDAVEWDGDVALEISKIFDLNHPSSLEAFSGEVTDPTATLTRGNKQYDPLDLARQLGLDD